MILTSGDSISIFFRLLPYTTYIIPIASFIIAVVIGLSIRGKACRIERTIPEHPPISHLSEDSVKEPISTMNTATSPEYCTMVFFPSAV